MNAHWWNLPALLTPAECDRVIRHALTHYQPQQGVVGQGNQTRADQMRRSIVRWLDFADLDLLWLYRRIESKILEANAQAFGYHLQHSFSPEIQFTEYHGSDEGHYDWHTDNASTMRAPFDRKLSFVLQLSSRTPQPGRLIRRTRPGYTGGEFELDPNADPLPPRAYTDAGDALIFRSSLRHRVKPVTSGIRYTLVTWVKGPRA